jgi:hypothetical protein
VVNAVEYIQNLQIIKKTNKKTSALFKGTTNIGKLTAVSDQVLNCQPKIVILNNIPSLSYY